MKQDKYQIYPAPFREKNLELVKEYDSRIPDVLMGDPVRLHQIIINLVSNAVKFTTTGKITVGVHLLEEDENHATLEFTVTDTGIGISQDKINMIYEMFSKVTPSNKGLYKGLGLGLPIAKQFTHELGGELAVQSVLGVGSVFTCTFQFDIA